VDLDRPNPECHASSELSLREFYFGSFKMRKASKSRRPRSPEDPKVRSPEARNQQESSDSEGRVAPDPRIRGFMNQRF
jgi:hypothetical protein